MTLVEFLLARIAEDERRAGPLHEHRAWWGGPVPPPVGVKDPCGACGKSRAEPVWSRVLAECEAKRRIVEPWTVQWTPPPDGYDSRTDEENWCYGVHSAAHDAVLRLLALPYADHPDYDETWRL